VPYIICQNIPGCLPEEDPVRAYAEWDLAGLKAIAGKPAQSRRSQYLFLLRLAGNRPSEEDCRKAAMNLQKLRGLDTNPQAPDPEVAVRRCRTSGDSKSVRCLIAAKTAAEADQCGAAAK